MTKKIYLSAPWTGDFEQEAALSALASGWVAPCGPHVDAFEKGLQDLSGLFVAAVSSGTAALDLLMAEYGIGPDWMVFASTLTFIATVGSAVHRGAKPIFIDADSATGTISIPLLEEALSKASGKKLVLAADIYGQCCDYTALENVCAQYDALLIIDAAEAVGATWQKRPAGCAGAASVYSFNGNKLLTTSGGGAVLSRDVQIVNRARWRAQQARENVVWYEHKEVGYNYRLSNICAAIGLGQLKRLSAILEAKKRIFNFYSALLSPLGISPFPCAPESHSSHWLSVFLFPDSAARDAAAARLAADNIECRPVWKPMHLQSVFAHNRVVGGEVAEDLFTRGLCLPSGANLTEADLERIATALLKR